MLRIKDIEISDTYFTRHARFAPGTVTRITGANGQGKSSILRALLYIFEGGLDASVIRKGAERSIITFTLSNGVTVTKTTAKIKPRRGAQPDEAVRYKADLEITDSDGSVINAPMTYLNELSEALAVDPSVLLRIDATTVPGRKQLAGELLRLVPIAFSGEEVNRACAFRSNIDVPMGHPDAIALEQSTDLDLDGLKKVAAQITEQRRRFGATRDDTDGAINRLEKSLPENDGSDQSTRIASLEAERVDLERQVGEAKLNIEQQKSEAISEATKEFNSSVEAAEKQYRDALAEIEKIRSAAKSEAQELLNTRRVKILEVTAEEMARIESTARPEQQRISGELATAKEQQKATHRAETLRQEIQIQLATLRDASWKFDQLTAVLENIEKLRLEKLNNLPVGGLVVENGEAYLDGIAWANVNLARRVEAVLQICTQRSGKLPLLIVDDCEHLDTETRASLEQGLAEAGFQLIEAVVTDGPLNIECLNEVAA